MDIEISLSLSWMTTSYPHLFFTWPTLLPLPSFCNENLNSYFMNYRNKQTNKTPSPNYMTPSTHVHHHSLPPVSPSSLWIHHPHHHCGSIIPIVTVDPSSASSLWIHHPHHHCGSIIPIITVDPLFRLLTEQLFPLSTTSHPFSPS